MSLQSAPVVAVPARTFFALMARFDSTAPARIVGLPEHWCVVYAPSGKRDKATGFVIRAAADERTYHVVGDAAEQWLRTGSQTLARLVASTGPWRPTLLVRLLMVFGFRPCR